MFTPSEPERPRTWTLGVVDAAAAGQTGAAESSVAVEQEAVGGGKHQTESSAD